MRITEAWAHIGGFCVFLHYIFGFVASYINKRLYLSELMQQRYTMHKNTDFDHSNDPQARYRAQFDLSRKPPSNNARSATPGQTVGGGDERLSNRQSTRPGSQRPMVQKSDARPSVRSGRNEGGSEEDEEAFYMGGERGRTSEGPPASNLGRSMLGSQRGGSKADVELLSNRSRAAAEGKIQTPN